MAVFTAMYSIYYHHNRVSDLILAKEFLKVPLFENNFRKMLNQLNRHFGSPIQVMICDRAYAKIMDNLDRKTYLIS